MKKPIFIAVLILCVLIIAAAAIAFMYYPRGRSQAVTDAIDGLWTINDYLNVDLFAKGSEDSSEMKLADDFPKASQQAVSAIRLECGGLEGLLSSHKRMSKDDRQLIKRSLRALERLDEVLSDTKADWRSEEYLDKLSEPLSVLSSALANDMISSNLKLTTSREPYDWEKEN